MRDEKKTLRLLKKGSLYRKFLLECKDGSNVIEYNGWGGGYESIIVDGVYNRYVSLICFRSGFEFTVGSEVFVVYIKVWPWLKIRSFKIVCDGETIYSE